jgi:CRISPR-associated endoribonuclease Cas6
MLLKGPKQSIIPFNYQPGLTGAIHKWIGKNNDVHDSMSLYSFSWLFGGRPLSTGIMFPKGARFFFSAFDSHILRKLISGIKNDPEVAFGFRVSDIVICEPPEFEMESIEFRYGSPIFVKRTISNKAVHYTFAQPESDRLLTETLRNKLSKAGLSVEGVSVAFKRDYPGARTKVIYYKDVGNRVNLCPVVVKGTPEQLAFAWDVGVGNSTGIGFGALQ